MNTQPSDTSKRLLPAGSAEVRSWMPPVCLAGHVLSLAQDVAELETCLHLERSAPRTSTLFGVDSEGIESPSAIPYCDFLMLREAGGDLAGVCRLLAHGSDIPVHNSLASRRFHLSPLVTAIRYSRLDMVEVGPLVVRSDRRPESVISLLWEGILRYMDRNGSAILLGRERMPLDVQGGVIPQLLSAHGLHPDLEVEAREAYRAHPLAVDSPALARLPPNSPVLPASFQEALRRGCRLACEPVLAADRHCLELVWVANREMLDTGADWRRPAGYGVARSPAA